ncbi:hypothetical protein B0H11DRAFT_1363078 [Mycena galericulata]|nr:hypothetical protein B0H11DRAFT_1363078 [Mycena galericulata]
MGGLGMFSLISTSSSHKPSFTTSCAKQTQITLSLYFHPPTAGSSINLAQCWLSQANYIFHQCSISADYEEYSVVSSIRYKLTLSPTSQIYPVGFLFLSPLDHFKSEDGAFIKQPESPAYWSLEPSGRERLCAEEASALGFPAFELECTVLLRSWDERVYAGLSQFHADKGFDPYSQDIARHLGCPLYEVSCDPGPIGARIYDVSPEADVDIGDPITIPDEDSPQHEDAQDKQDHQKSHKSVLGILAQNTRIYRCLIAHDFICIIAEALIVVLALLFAYLYS